MLENFGKLPPAERLRHYLSERARQLTAPEYRREDLTPYEQAHGIANSMVLIYEAFRDLREGVPGYPVDGIIREHAKETLEGFSRDWGFDSIDGLERALNELREQLRRELKGEEWVTYFEKTL